MSHPRKKNKADARRAKAPAPLSRGRLWAFRLVGALGIPLALLVVAELVLRVAGFGYPTRFWLSSERDGEKVLVQNNQFGWRFFGAKMARLPEPFCITRKKPAGTVRIVVLGESAALGDPQPRFGLPRMLQAMLELRYPHTHFEVVNAGIVAINSNVILPIARDLASADADVWVVYMGNNEVVGPFGAGTVFGQQALPLPLIRANLALKATRIGQVGDLVRQEFQKPSAGKSEWGGMEMFLDQRVTADDPRMKAVYSHFRQNLADIVKAGRRAGAGVVVSTVAVNLRECPPFGSAHRSGLGETERNRWTQLFEAGAAAQTGGNFAEAARLYGQAAQIDNEFAELRYRAGVCALALGQAELARTEMMAARDLDTLRFRCDSRLNEIIRQSVAEDHDAGVTLADAERAFAAAEPDGLPGDAMFYEHVHLTFEGNYRLASVLAPKVEAMLPKEVRNETPGEGPWPAEGDCARRLAYSDWDRQEALADIHARLTLAPYTGQFGHSAKVQNLEKALNALGPASQPEGIRVARQRCEEALGAFPDDALIREELAILDQRAGDLVAAETNAQRALALLPGAAEYASQLGVILAKQRKYEPAIAAFRQAFALNGQDVWALQNAAQSLNDLGRTDEAVREYRRAVAINPRFGLAWLGLGQLLEKGGRKEEAEDCYRKAIENRINRAPELKTLAQFCESRGWREAAATNYEAILKLTPSDAGIQVAAGKNLAAMGRNVEAAQCYASAVRLAPDMMEAHYLYGLELGRAGKSEEAAGQFREAVRIMPNLPEARLNLGTALEKAGKYEEALAEFETVLKQSPGNALAANHVQALRQRLAPTADHNR